MKLGDSPGKGRGVFAAEKIKSGEVILSDPVVAFDEGELWLVKNCATLSKYHWNWRGKYGAFVFGLGSMLNHSDDPNARFEERHIDRKMVFYAKRDINIGEEILINYAENV